MPPWLKTRQHCVLAKMQEWISIHKHSDVSINLLRTAKRTSIVKPLKACNSRDSLASRSLPNHSPVKKESYSQAIHARINYQSHSLLSRLDCEVNRFTLVTAGLQCPCMSNTMSQNSVPCKRHEASSSDKEQWAIYSHLVPTIIFLNQ